MARKWKRQQVIQLDTTDMIEHSINRYETKVIPAYTHTPQTFQRSALVTVPNGQQFYSKEKYDAYIKDLKARGFDAGVEIVTKYGVPGKIGRFLECPMHGIAFYTDAKPNVMYIMRHNNDYTSIAYNEDEIKLVEITEGSAE